MTNRLATVTPLVPVQGTPPCLTDTAPDDVETTFCDGCDRGGFPVPVMERTSCGMTVCPDCLDVHYAHDTSYAACHEPICND